MLLILSDTAVSDRQAASLARATESARYAVVVVSPALDVPALVNEVLLRVQAELSSTAMQNAAAELVGALVAAGQWQAFEEHTKRILSMLGGQGATVLVGCLRCGKRHVTEVYDLSPAQLEVCPDCGAEPEARLPRVFIGRGPDSPAPPPAPLGAS